MNKELAKLIASGESGTIEFKESFGKAAIEAITAFANGDGGFVCVGVGNGGIIKGVLATEEDIKDWLNQLKTATEPSLFPRYNVYDCDGHCVILFVVQEYPVKPVACKGRYFRRHGASNHRLTADEIVDLKLQSMNASFDSFTVLGGMAELDAIALDKFSGDIEKYGTGYIRIRNQLKQEYPHLLLDMVSEHGGFVATIGLTQETTQETTQEVSLGNTQRDIIRLFKENSKCTRQDLVRVLGKSDAAIKEHIAILKKNGVIKRHGSSKGGYWEVVGD